MKSLFAGLSLALALTASPTQAEDRGPFWFATSFDEAGSLATNISWWMRLPIVRPMSTTVSGVTMAQLNAARGAEAYGDPDPWCYASNVSRESYSALDRAVMVEIDQTFAEQPDAEFRQAGNFTGEGMQDAVVGFYETCAGEQGAFLLITDRSPEPRVIYIWERQDWNGLIWLAKDGEALSIGSCFACGHNETLFYDPRRTRF